jgi:Fic family protein
MDPDGAEDARSFLQKLQNLYHLQEEVDRVVTGVAETNSRFVLSEDIIKRLHLVAMRRLLDDAGHYRTTAVTLRGSPYIPPNWTEVPALMGTMCQYVNQNWDNRDLVHLSAYCLWRLNWIHPFRNGNGRTSRAVSYMVLCARFGALLPAQNTVVQQIAQNKGPFQNALRAADQIYAAGQQIDSAMMQLEQWITQLLKEQLRSNF